MSKSGKVIRKRVRGRNLRETASPTRGVHGKAAGSATRKKKKRGNAEHMEQAKFTAFMRTYHPSILFFAIPNGGYRTASEAARLKAEGVLAGVADIFVAQSKEGVRETISYGLFLEFKAPGKSNTQSAAQKEFEEKALVRGYGYAIVDSAADAVREVYDYLDFTEAARKSELLELLQPKNDTC